MPDDFDVPMPTRSLLPVKIATTEPIYAQGVVALGLTNDQMAYLSFNCGWELWRDKDARFLLRNYRIVTAGYLEAWRATPDSSFLGDGTDTLLNDLVKEAKFVPAGRELGDDDEPVFATGGMISAAARDFNERVCRYHVHDVSVRLANAVRQGGRDPGPVPLSDVALDALVGRKSPIIIESKAALAARLKPEDRVGVHVEGRGPAREGSRPGDVGGATKLDAGKAPVFNGFINYFPRAMIAVAWVSEYGFRKYGEWGGWRKVLDGISRYFDGNSRHHVMQGIEPYDDSDSGLAHAAQDAWNAMAKLELMLTEGKIEARRGNDVVDGKPVLDTARKMS